jgi:putative FmdB family regulatory protein
MPTYEFHCQSCGADFEITSSVAEHEQTKATKEIVCTECGSTDVAARISHFDVRTTRKSA